MASILVCCIVVLNFVFLPVSYISAQITTLSNLDDEFSNIFDAYYDKQAVVPVQTVGSAMIVSVDFDLVSVVGFDDDTGSAIISGYLTVKWTEERYTTVADDIDVSISASSIWTPPLVIVNSLSSVPALGSDHDTVKLNLNTAQVVWKPEIYTKVKCDSNAFFPFDKQECSVKISSRALDDTEMTISVTQSNIGTTHFIENGLWEFKKSSAVSDSVNSYSRAVFKFTIQRKSQYITFIIVSPTISISIVHLFVFLLPSNTEKSNYSITSMIGVTVVLLWTIYNIPLNTEPVSIIVYYIFTEFLLNVAVLIFALNIFKELSDSLQNFVPKQKSESSSRKNDVIRPETRKEPSTARGDHVSSVNTAWDDVDLEEDSQEKDISSEKTTNKPDISTQIMSPFFVFVLFLGLHAIFTIGFFVSLGLNVG